MKIRVNIIEVLHKANLVSVSAEQRNQLFVVHAPEDRAFADLEPIEMKNGKNSTGLLRVDVFDAMPRAIHC